MLVALASIALATAALAVPASAAADTEGAIVIAVDIVPRAQPAAANLARAGLDPSAALLIAAALGLSGVAAVVVARRRSA